MTPPRRARFDSANVEPLGHNRYAITCAHCKRSAVVVAPNSGAASVQLAADGWKRKCCPECDAQARAS